ncbi:MAG: DUF460 domain-containing protein [Asgard group archaeon]|nr:DUF460 domain-containing protein [Asgard group archaeon]
MSKIIGVDILPGSAGQKGSYWKNKFAAVVWKDGKVIEEHETLSIGKLINLCKIHEPKFLAVDNIFELGANSGQVVKFCSKLPLETKIIQVTGAPPDGFETVRRLANRNGIPYPSQHADPLQTAAIISQLANKKVGYILLPFEEETEIKISRTRSIGSGGWSQQRYARRMRGEILQLSRDVEKQLQDHDIDFDLEAKKTKFGYDNAVFRAYASVKKVKQIIRPFKGELSRIEVTPIRKKRLEFIPAKGGRKRIRSGVRRKFNRGIIVGIDPGHNTGVAILNFRGKILLLENMKSSARGDVIRKITLEGDPVLIAADVTPPPKFVEKLSKMLNAGLYYPNRLLSSDEKMQLVMDFTKETKVKVKGAHKKDALAAAIKAYNKYKETFEKINQELSEPDEYPLRNKVKKLVLKEEANIQEAIKQIKKEQEKPERPVLEQEEKEILTEKERKQQEKIEAQRELINRQMTQIDNLEDQNDDLYHQVKDLQDEKKELEKSLTKARNKRNQEIRKDQAVKIRDDELRFLRGKVRKLEEELEKYKKIIGDLKRMIVMSSDKIVVPMKVIYEFSREGILETIERMNIEPHDVVFLVDPSGGGQNTAEMLIDREVKAVICNKKNISDPAMEAFIKADIPVLFNMSHKQIDDIAVTYYNELENAISDWEEQREKILQEKVETQIGKIIAEYQEKRKKELANIYQMKRRRK